MQSLKGLNVVDSHVVYNRGLAIQESTCRYRYHITEGWCSIARLARHPFNIPHGVSAASDVMSLRPTFLFLILWFIILHANHSCAVTLDRNLALELFATAVAISALLSMSGWRTIELTGLIRNKRDQRTYCAWAFGGDLVHRPVSKPHGPWLRRE